MNLIKIIISKSQQTMIKRAHKCWMCAMTEHSWRLCFWVRESRNQAAFCFAKTVGYKSREFQQEFSLFYDLYLFFAHQIAGKNFGILEQSRDAFELEKIVVIFRGNEIVLSSLGQGWKYVSGDCGNQQMFLAVYSMAATECTRHIIWIFMEEKILVSKNLFNLLL